MMPGVTLTHSGARFAAFTSQLCLLPTVWLWASFSASLNFKFLFCRGMYNTHLRGLL